MFVKLVCYCAVCILFLNVVVLAESISSEPIDQVNAMLVSIEAKLRQNRVDLFNYPDMIKIHCSGDLLELSGVIRKTDAKILGESFFKLATTPGQQQVLSTVAVASYSEAEYLKFMIELSNQYDICENADKRPYISALFPSWGDNQGYIVQNYNDSPVQAIFDKALKIVQKGSDTFNNIKIIQKGRHLIIDNQCKKAMPMVSFRYMKRDLVQRNIPNEDCLHISNNLQMELDHGLDAEYVVLYWQQGRLCSALHKTTDRNNYFQVYEGMGLGGEMLVSLRRKNETIPWAYIRNVRTREINLKEHADFVFCSQKQAVKISLSFEGCDFSKEYEAVYIYTDKHAELPVWCIKFKTSRVLPINSLISSVDFDENIEDQISGPLTAELSLLSGRKYFVSGLTFKEAQGPQVISFGEIDVDSVAKGIQQFTVSVPETHQEL